MGVWESTLLKQLIPPPLLLIIVEDGRHPQEDAVAQVRDRQPLLHHPQLRGGDQGVEQEVTLEELDKNLRASTKMAADNEQKLDCDIRDYGKKVHGLEIEFDETCDKLQKATESLEEKEKMYREVEGDVSALSRRIMLMEEEAKKSEENLAGTVTKLATTSKEADNILKKVKAVESTCMNNEVTLEELDKNLRASTKMAADNEQKLDELSRKLGVQEDELKRAIERAELAENKLKSIEEELQLVGENMKSLETSAEKAVE